VINTNSLVEVLLSSVSKCFYDIFIGVVIGAVCCIFLLEGVLISWSLAIDERGGHEDLRDSDRQTVISYVHGRTELYFSKLYEHGPFSPTPVKRCLPDPFIAQG
jgi:hypothetical protein